MLSASELGGTLLESLKNRYKMEWTKNLLKVQFALKKEWRSRNNKTEIMKCKPYAFALTLVEGTAKEKSVASNKKKNGETEEIFR